MFKGIVDRLNGGKGGREKDESGAELARSLQSLAAVDPALPGRCARFVLDGTDPGLLVELGGSTDPRLCDYLGDPGSTPMHFHGRLDEDTAIGEAVPGWTVEKAIASRRRLHLQPTGLSGEQYVRLGGLLAAVQTGPIPMRTSPLVPDWLAALLGDVFDTTLDMDDRPGTNGNTPPPRWTVAFVQSLLTAAGLEEGPEFLLAAMFDRRPVGWYHGEFALHRLRTIPGLVELATAQAAVLAAQVPSYSIAGRREVLQFIERVPGTAAPLATVLAVLSTDVAKTVRTDALRIVGTMPAELLDAVLAPVVHRAPVSRLKELIDALLRHPDGAQLLRKALAEDDSGPRGALLRAGVERSELMRTPDAVIPRSPFAPLTDSPLRADHLDHARAAIDDQIRRCRESITELRSEDPPAWPGQLKLEKEKLADLRGLTTPDLQEIAEHLAGNRAPGRFSIGSALRHLATEGLLPPLTLMQAIRLSVGELGHVQWYRLGSRPDLDVDLRSLAEAAARAGDQDPVDGLARYLCSTYSNRLDDFSPGHLWPFFDENPRYLSEGLGLTPPRADSWRDFPTDAALDILGMFPAVPPRYLPPVVELALGEAKTHRRAAQQLLERRGVAVDLALHGLADGRTEIRTSAAAWLARIGDPAAVTALRSALATESRETARAAYLTALEGLGDDISGDLAPVTLLAEATSGLKGKRPAALAWFPFDHLPRCRWAVGEEVPPTVITWWVILANKLKDPAGTGLLHRYVGLLDTDSAAVLGEFVLHAWITQDVRRPSDAESRAYAAVEGPRNWQLYQHWAASTPQYAHYVEQAALPVEAHVQQAWREHQGIYLGSAIANKGVLALATRAPGAVLARIIGTYMKDHYTRRFQVEALISCAAMSDERSPMQLLLSVARRHRTASVQAKAAELVEVIAQRHGWSPDQLADRTVPTAGFDEHRLLELTYGEREFVGRISPAFALELTGPHGAVIKSLPAARMEEDPEIVKAAKSQLSASRKELKQILELQTGRLYEAMCAQRSWPAAEWTEYLLGHPLVSLLAGRLVWVRSTSPDGSSPEVLFRPTPEGSLIDAQDDEVAIDEGATITLAHAALTTHDQIDVWQQHLADYRVTPLFPQFDGSLPPVGTQPISDRLGWFTDTFTIRGGATKRGYQRGAPEDGGWFTEYHKDFTGLGIRVVLGFTGSTLPEENIPAAITRLTFRSLDRRARGDLAPDKVPAVLLAEAYADYLAVAGSGTFDPAWEKKTGW
ncbi:DUF4132 domain-containing protein [Nakamurella silvestris]|nr:DUF4132 domain-containing protein [Nakamurella silvestris]